MATLVEASGIAELRVAAGVQCETCIYFSPGTCRPPSSIRSTAEEDNWCGDWMGVDTSGGCGYEVISLVDALTRLPRK